MIGLQPSDAACEAWLVTAYRLVFQGLDTARIRPEDAGQTAPLAWFRVTYVDASNETSAVHVYGHHEHVPERPWLATHESIAAAVAFCDSLPLSGGSGDYDWSEGSVVTSPDA
jgi:hypothetical protein